jgi:hypothetical protein
MLPQAPLSKKGTDPALPPVRQKRRLGRGLLKKAILDFVVYDL